ncbi:MAG: hypothetical protein L0H25_08280 [Micrococcales bacterium]|nr:hypothetical protein [Micrococcales bacterium]
MSGDGRAGADGRARGADPTGSLTIGHRVVVRYRLPEGSTHGATDVLGVLLARDADVLTVEARTGPVTIARSDVILAREVPPAPARRG